MNKFKYYFILIIAGLSLFSCSKDDNSIKTEPLRDYAAQYEDDIVMIEEYLNTYYIEEIIDNPGETNNQDVVFTKIPEGGDQPSIMSYLNSETFPKLLVREVELHNITYKIYYLVLREGSGESPTNVDEFLASYKGEYLSNSTDSETQETTLASTFFEEIKYPNAFFGLNETIVGWSEIFPQFKTGTYESNSDGTISYSDFGAGVMFLPSGLAYYNVRSGSIPGYSPLIFSFKLYEINRTDLDGDGIPNYLEDLDGDGYLREVTIGDQKADDSDGDGIPDYLDIDDDGDGYTTKTEITDGEGNIYDFELIPDCSGDTSTPDRIKKYLDSNCH